MNIEVKKKSLAVNPIRTDDGRCVRTGYLEAVYLFANTASWSW